MKNDVIEITKEHEGDLVLSDEALIKLAEVAERRIAALNSIKKCALKMTNANDWVDQGGRPYLQASGAEKIARLFGISWKIDDPSVEIDSDGHFRYIYKGYFTLQGVTIEAVGSRSSRDMFFRQYSGVGESRVELPPSAIDRGDVQKAAYSNLLVNGVTRILGIRNMTWADLSEFADIERDMVTSVRYRDHTTGRERRDIAHEGGERVVGVIADIRQREGRTKAGKPWTQYVIRMIDSPDEYTTFSQTAAARANEYMLARRQVVMEYVVDRFGKTIKSLEPHGQEESNAGRED